jgi:MerR family transcriptional regulator, light-induced transcriptional regulator
MEYEKYLREFSTILASENKDASLNYALSLVKEEKMGVVDLYTRVLGPALNQMTCDEEDQRLCIWREHVHTAIIRTIVESCYPFVIAERDRQNNGNRGKAAVLCPPEEHHELGARMVADFLTICGFDTIFVGSNTPYADFINGVEVLQLNLIAISVTNFYHLVVTKKIVADLREKVGDRVKIIIGGNAFDSNPDHIKAIGADHYTKNFEDIKKIADTIQAGERN